MGDVSIIARRLETGKYVQYGWGGNGGNFSLIGARLLYWYDDPDKVEYLFSLGQMKLIGKPGSENGGESFLNTHIPACEPHYLGKSEREIFSKIAFVDIGYFYDLDNRWYYIIPGPFRIKIPLAYIENHLNAQNQETEECIHIEHMVMNYILGTYYEADLNYQNLVNSKFSDGIEGIRKELMASTFPINDFWENYSSLFTYFDDWVVIETTEDMKNISGILMKPKWSSNRQETIEW